MRPLIKFTGDEWARRMNSVFAENLQDLLDKVEDGAGEYERGFLHTSTIDHEGTCYYDQMWSRDCGRGIIELAKLGFKDEALWVTRYFLSHMNFGDHWGRELTTKHPNTDMELDGNANVILGMYNTYRAWDSDKGIAMEIIDGVKPVIDWMEGLSMKSPYDGLLPSRSELSGNPETDYLVYGIFGNYGALNALKSLLTMVEECRKYKEEVDEFSNRLQILIKRISDGIEKYLISDGISSLTEEGCFINGMDSREKKPYDICEFADIVCDCWHWTRQTPYIFHGDIGQNVIDGEFEEVHKKSYRFLRKYMNDGKYFRKYGFVSNTGWTGMGGRHDDTMCGYGQAYFTQAALIADDINTYSKCFEGIARLAYDGDIILHKTNDINPWVMHECFDYSNYEEGLDHTYGPDSEEHPGVANNPGDEGNLVQAAEVIKALRIVVGVESKGGKLIIMPRLPWTCDSIEVRNYPVADKDGIIRRIGFIYAHERWLRKTTLTLTSCKGFEKIDVRFGPYPYFIKDNRGYQTEQVENGTWMWQRNQDVSKGEFVVDLNG